MRGCVANQAGNIFFEIPADMVHQPVDFGRQLHIALDADGRLVAPQRNAGQRQRRGFRDVQLQIGRRALRRQVEQARRRHQQGHGIGAPLHARHAASLAHQAVHGFLFLHQHMVEKKDHALLHLVHQPLRRLRAGGQAVNETIQK